MLQMKVPLVLKVRPLASADELLAQPAHCSHSSAGQYWTAGGQHTRQPLKPMQAAQKLATAATAALAKPAANATTLLETRIQQVQEQAFDAEAVMQHPDVQQRVHITAAVATDVPFGAVLYHGLQPIDNPDLPCGGVRLVPKQLHPAWVAKRHMKPELHDLWKATEQHVAVLDTERRHHHVKFSRKSVAGSMLSLQS